MAKAFSVASWNVEHFRGDSVRVARVVDFLAEQNPDVFALYEVEGKEVFSELVQRMPKYSFHITEGPQAQEILVGVRSNLTAFFTQKIAFKSAVSLLRPGALLTLRVDGVDYSILFLHTKSGDDPRGLGLRDDMLVKAVDFKKTLDKAMGQAANYLFLGDLNTMGMNYKFVSSGDIPASDELLKLDRKAKRRKMVRLVKDEPATFWNGPSSPSPPSDLDQVVAADHLDFKTFGGANVSVRGWPKEPTDQKKGEWIERFSDHALLFVEVQKA